MKSCRSDGNRSDSSEKRWVYFLDEGSRKMATLLGGKGANLAEMYHAGLPVPPAFIISTNVSRYFMKNDEVPAGFWDHVERGIKKIEKNTNKFFGTSENTLLVSVRSGAPVSMPGMMDTILNIGLDANTLKGIAKKISVQFAIEIYRRFLFSFAETAMEMPGEKMDILTENALKCESLERILDLGTKLVNVEDIWEQLRISIVSVLKSWNCKRAVTYRKFSKIPDELGTAVVVQAMVFGNLGPNSGTGVAFSRNPLTGEKTIFGDFLAQAQGEDVVAGKMTSLSLDFISKSEPELYGKLTSIGEKLEGLFGNVQDFEFTIENNNFYLLQSRNAKLSSAATIKSLVDLAEEGNISRDEVIKLISPQQIKQFSVPCFKDGAKNLALEEERLLCKGISASQGVAVGLIVLDSELAHRWKSEENKDVILLRSETSPKDIQGIIAASGIVTRDGGPACHAAVVARGLDKPCIVGCKEIEFLPNSEGVKIGNRTFREGNFISIDGTAGEIFSGEIAVTRPSLRNNDALLSLLTWSKEKKTVPIWGEVNDLNEILIALENSVDGIVISEPVATSVLDNKKSKEMASERLSKTTTVVLTDLPRFPLSINLQELVASFGCSVSIGGSGLADFKEVDYSESILKINNEKLWLQICIPRPIFMLSKELVRRFRGFILELDALSCIFSGWGNNGLVSENIAGYLKQCGIPHPLEECDSEVILPLLDKFLANIRLNDSKGEVTILIRGQLARNPDVVRWAVTNRIGLSVPVSYVPPITLQIAKENLS